MHRTCSRIAWFSLLAAALLTGCGKKKETPAPEASASATAVDELEQFLKDREAPLTKEVYKRMVLALATCKVDERGIDPKCEASKNLREARNRKTSLKDMAAMNAEVGQELIGHEHPAVRLQAAKLMQSVFGTNEDTQKLIVGAAKKEKEPAVLAAMLRTIGSRHRQSNDIKELLLSMSDHQSEVVRREAMSWFLTSFGEGVPGTFEKVLDKVEKDPSEDVRAYLCGRLYGSADERALDVFEKLLGDEKTPTKLYNACWNGVINAWTGFPKPRKPSKRGYELTLKVLEKKPRTKDLPPWSGISTLRSAKTEYPENDRFGRDWLEAVKPWYQAPRLLRALQSIATDTNANWMARQAALRVMHELGEKKSTFETLAKKYKDANSGDDFHVKKQIEDLLKKMETDAARGAGASSGKPSPIAPPPVPAPPGPALAPPAPAPPPEAPAP